MTVDAMRYSGHEHIAKVGLATATTNGSLNSISYSNVASAKTVLPDMIDASSHAAPPSIASTHRCIAITSSYPRCRHPSCFIPTSNFHHNTSVSLILLPSSLPTQYVRIRQKCHYPYSAALTSSLNITPVCSDVIMFYYEETCVLHTTSVDLRISDAQCRDKGDRLKILTAP